MPQLSGNLTPGFGGDPWDLRHWFSTQGLFSCRAALETGVWGSAGSGSVAGLPSTVLSVPLSGSGACGPAGNVFKSFFGLLALIHIMLETMAFLSN